MPAAPTVDPSSPILDSLSTGVVLTDNDGKVLSLNTAAEALLGMSRQQASGRSLDALFEDAPAISRLLDRSGETGEKLLQRELMLKRRADNGRAVLVDCRIAPLADKATGAFLIELDDIQQRLRIRYDEERTQRREASQSMLRQLAHEIRNPLSGMRGAAQLLERELDDAALGEYTRVIVAEADRLNALVGDLLGPTSLPSLMPHNIHEIVEHVRTLVEPEMPDHVTLQRAYDPSLPVLNIDRDHLVQALLNIVRNAMQAVGQQGTIELRTRAESNCLIGKTRHRLAAVVDVCDDGPGVPENLRDRLFLPLVTGRPEGHGLGLAIAQELVGRHDGSIDYATRAGQTRFSIMLPVPHG